MRWVACAACATLVAACLPLSAFATTSSHLAASVRAKRREAAVLERKLAATRPVLMDALAKADQAEAALQDIRSQMLDTESSIQSLQAEIDSGEARLNDRAIALYESGGLDAIEALLSGGSLEDLLSRMDMLSYIQENDSRMVADLTTARDQAAFLQGQQAQQENQLITARQQADARQAVVQAIIAQQQLALRSVGADIDRLVASQETARSAAAALASGSDGVPDPPVGFNPNSLVSDSVFTDSSSMTAVQVQAFLDSQDGALKSYSGRDHAGVVRSAAEMIADAAQTWDVSPKVILVTLQKEQSLLSDPSPSRRALDWAMGCGKMDGSTITSYQGFGNQIWGGARALTRNRSHWFSGISLSIDGNAVYPSSPSTHSLYRYTPHLHGAIMFWRLFWRYFGDPNA